MHRRVVLWDWELMYFRAFVYIIFVYRVVYVDMSTRSSQLNHLNLENLPLRTPSAPLSLTHPSHPHPFLYLPPTPPSPLSDCTFTLQALTPLLQ